MALQTVRIPLTKLGEGERVHLGDFPVPLDALQVVVTFDLPAAAPSRDTEFWFGWDWPLSKNDSVEGCGVDWRPHVDSERGASARRFGAILGAEDMPQDPEHRVLRLWVQASAAIDVTGQIDYLEPAQSVRALVESIRFGDAPVVEKTAADLEAERKRREAGEAAVKGGGRGG